MSPDPPPGADEDLVAAIRDAYATSAAGWAEGPAAVYRWLAAALLDAAPEALSGRRILDLGAGTGVASDALVRAGAAPVGLDLAVEMLQHRRATRPPAVAADARALPFVAAAFDAVVAAFSLNHVPDLERALAECRRVTRRGGWLLASTFPRDVEHPAKPVVEEVLTGYGYRRPEWYATFKAQVAERTGDPDGFVGAARRAGLVDVEVAQVAVEAGLDDPDLAGTWRCNMPHTLAFVAGLDPARRTALHRDVAAALARVPLPSDVTMLTLGARIP